MSSKTDDVLDRIISMTRRDLEARIAVLKSDLAAAKEREAALSAAVCRDQGPNYLPDFDLAAIYQRVRVAAKREALKGIYKTFSERLTGIPGPELRFAVGRIFEILNAALAALDAEEKGDQG
jgi:hypothetical protein